MENLVIMHDSQAVTTSLKVAESFRKAHRNVLASIKNFTAENSAVKNMFVESTYINRRGQEQPMFYMNRDGFSLLVMGFTGNKALQFKLQYIEAFNRMEQLIKEEALTQTPEEKLKLTMEAATHLDQRLSTVEDEITDMKENAEIDSTQRYQLLQERNHRVMSIVGGKNSNYYLEHKANKVYAKMFADLKKVFKVPRYNALPKKDFERASKFIQNWYPDVVLKDEIDKANAQQRLEL